MKPLIGFFSPHMVTNLAPRLRAPELHDSASPLCWPNSSFTFTLFTHHFITLAARVNHSTALSAVYLCIYLRTLILDIYALALPKNYSCYFFMVFFIVYFVGVYDAMMLLPSNCTQGGLKLFVFFQRIQICSACLFPS